MIEQGNEADGGFIVQSGLVGDGVNETDGGAVRAVQVVQTGREDELLQHATQTGLLGIEQNQFKVEDVLGLDASLGSNKLDEVGVMALGHGLERREVIHLLGVVTSARSLSAAGLGFTSAVELGSKQASDGEQLCLLVE